MLLLLPIQLPGFGTFAKETAPVVPGRMTYNSVVNQQSYVCDPDWSGLWDVFDRGEAVRKVLSWRAQAGTVDGVAAHLAAEAVARGNNDNCSVVVVEFVWGAEG